MTWRASALACGLLAAGAVAVWLSRDDPDAGSAGAASALTTVTVERRTLIERDFVNGTLGFADARTVIHWATGARPARLTWLAPEGSVLRRGQPLYRVDEHGVTLLYGTVPSYRTLRPGVRGVDVRQLERNLRALGFGAGTMRVDLSYTQATAAAVRQSGLSRAGVVAAGRVVFLPGARRVGAHLAEVGAVMRAGAEVMHVTSPRAAVNVELEASRQVHVRPGARVQVTLPDGRTARGQVARVGAVARPARRAGGEPVIDVVVAVPEVRRLTRLDAAPVTVALVRETRRDVLAVPITALLARPEGGYALQPVGSRTGLVAVTLGMASGGFVEVSGRAVADGMRVVAAQ